MFLDEFEIHLICSLFLIIIIIFGLIGNIFNLIVFGKKEMKSKSSTFRLLYYLSIIDIFVLLICTTDALLTFGFKIQIRLYSTMICRVHTFLTYFLSHMSSLTLMIVSVDRAFIVVQNRTLTCFKCNYIERFLMGLLCFLVLINLHYLFYYNINMVDRNHSNEAANLTDIKVEDGLTSMRLFNHNNRVIIARLETSTSEERIKYYSNDEKFIFDSIRTYLNKNFKNNNETPHENSIKNKHQQQQQQHFFVCSQINEHGYTFFLTKIWIWIDSSIYSFIPIVTMAVCSMMILISIKRKSLRFFKLTSTSNNNKTLIEKRIRKNKQILIMLMATNLFFIVCSLPYCIIYHKSNSERTETDFSLTLIIVHILSYSNNSFNFIFFTLFSDKYKEELKLTLCGPKSRQQEQQEKQIITIRTRTFKTNGVIKKKRNRCNNRRNETASLSLITINRRSIRNRSKSYVNNNVSTSTTIITAQRSRSICNNKNKFHHETHL